ncbi:MAG: L-glutamate gamma-semialdehyde dehydrogenase [Bacteroidales bacterium]|nr:L-glutamate gamma-semialdehyde dehydrogenase [Bacteroidales bacterium]
MNNYLYDFKDVKNETVLNYAPGSKEREEVKVWLDKIGNETLDIPIIIGGKEIRTGNTKKALVPHDHKTVLAEYHIAGKEELLMAVDAAMEAKKVWENMPWDQRAFIFLRAAELLATKYRPIMNAATMLNQSKTAYQAEIDSACELIDFWRFNVKFMAEIYGNQPSSSQGILNRLEYRPLEGFILAISPFNFTAIAGNLTTAPAMMGNTIVWKPASTAIVSGYYLMKLYKEAGLPDGVINFVPSSGATVGNTLFAHKDFAGVHFTGSTNTFLTMWKTIGSNIANFKSYPRIVGETGGKDFVFVHKSANTDAVATALVRGSFEYQGQKCSAASRAYIPASLWDAIHSKMKSQIETIKMGDVKDFKNFVAAVIDKAAFDSISGYINEAKKSDKAEIIIGGKCDDSVGYFIEPTVIKVTDPHFITMEEEIFGPVLTLYVYDDDKFEETLELCDNTSPYALTGSIFANDRQAILVAEAKLRNAAGNFYINDKPTGAVVGQQPFGGARASGTNDKAGSYLNLIRWVSPRTIKETFAPPTDYRYPFMD